MMKAFKMSNEKRAKWLQIAAGVLGGVLVTIFAGTLLSYTGDPISKAKARKIAWQYADVFKHSYDFSIVETEYFPFSDAYAFTFQDSTLEDVKFSVMCTSNFIISNDFNEMVEKRGAIRKRLEEEMAKESQPIVKEVLKSHGLKLTDDMRYIVSLQQHFDEENVFISSGTPYSKDMKLRGSYLITVDSRKNLTVDEIAAVVTELNNTLTENEFIVRDISVWFHTPDALLYADADAELIDDKLADNFEADLANGATVYMDGVGLFLSEGGKIPERSK